MKPGLLITLLACLLITCKNKSTDNINPGSKPFADIQHVVGIGRIEPENGIIQLSAEVGGIIQKVYKHENDTVKAGDIILELKHAVEDANIVQLRKAAAVQKTQIKVDESVIIELQIRFANSSVELQRLKNLLAEGAETQQVVDNATAEMLAFGANIKKLQATVEVSKMRWKETNAQVAIGTVQLKQKFITAPPNGILLELNAQIGNYIDSGKSTQTDPLPPNETAPLRPF